MVLVNDCRSNVSPVNNSDSDSDSDRLESHMTIAVDWDVKPQNNNNKTSLFLKKIKYEGVQAFLWKIFDTFIIWSADREEF